VAIPLKSFSSFSRGCFHIAFWRGQIIPRDQLSFKDFFLPFGGKGFRTPTKPFRMALGALIIKDRLGLMDDELVEQIKDNPYLQLYLGLEAFQSIAAP
jgi:IS5 family transposase